jgi:hypothetical protein
VLPTTANNCVSLENETAMDAGHNFGWKSMRKQRSTENQHIFGNSKPTASNIKNETVIFGSRSKADVNNNA